MKISFVTDEYFSFEVSNVFFNFFMQVNCVIKGGVGGGGMCIHLLRLVQLDPFGFTFTIPLIYKYDDNF